MTLLGKILTVIIFIMSLVFMTFSLKIYQTQKNWRDLVENPDSGLNKQVEELRALNEEHQRENDRIIDQANLEEMARRMAIATLTESSAIYASERDESTAENSQLLATLSQQTSALTASHTNLERTVNEIASHHQEARQARQVRDDALLEVVALTEQLHQGEGIRRRLEERRRQLTERIARMDRVLEANGATEFDPVPFIPPRLNGIVTAVGGDDNLLIEVSLGSDDGLRNGHFLEVYRGSQYLGRGVVRRIHPDQAVVELQLDFLQGPVQRGDQVATKVS